MIRRYSVLGWTLLLPAVTVSILGILAGCGGGGSAAPQVEVVIPSAAFPTALRFTPDGRLFYTEKDSGQVRVVANGALLAQPFATLPVSTTNEQGLLGIAIDPSFATNHFVYVFYSDAGGVRQRVGRFTESGNVGSNFTVIVDDIPIGTRHNAGKLEFGADGKLYVSVGEVGDPANAQNTGNVAGKVLRYEPNGSIPADNPLPGNPIYTFGHRNCFGMAMYPGTGTVYVSENGPTCDDEINRLVPGGNYGWRPNQPCGDTDPNYLQPLRRYSNIIAPTGIAFYSGAIFPTLVGDLLMTSFEEGSLRRLTINDTAPGSVISESLLVTGLNGPTDVTVSPDGNIYIATQSSIVRVLPPS